MESNIPYGVLSEIRFGIFDDYDVLAHSVVEIKNNGVVKGEKPIEGGLYDLHMGPINNEDICATCGNKRDACLGHCGHIKLNARVQSPYFIKEISRWLRVICYNCADIIKPKQLPKDCSSDKILSRMVKQYTKGTDEKSKARVCDNCGFQNPIVSRLTKQYLNMFGTENPINGTYTVLTPDEIFGIFDRIKNETVLALGKPLDCHPRKFIISNLLVIGNPMRPIKRTAGSTEIHNYTNLYKKIFETNMSIPAGVNVNKIQKAKEKIEYINKVYQLNTDIYNLIKNPKTPGDKATTRNNESISSRFPGKEGLFRGYGSGKRCLLTARSFITCDPTFPPNCIGVPKYIAMSIVIPVVVQEYNYQECLKYFVNKNNYPGCPRVRDGVTGVLKTVDRVTTIKIGDIIYRHLIDGDVYIHNRQPSLQSSNTLAMRVIVMHEGVSFRMNVMACKWYNADFDGDEMNMFITDKEAIMAEIIITSTPYNYVIDVKSGKPFLGQAHDSLYGSSQLTRSVTRMTPGVAMQMFANIPLAFDFTKLPPGVKPGIDGMFTGRDIVSILLRAMSLSINYSGKPEFFNEKHAPYVKYDPEDVNVKIVNGILVSGVLDNKSVGPGAYNGLVHIVHNDYGSKQALQLATYIQRISLNYLKYYGCTINTGDITIHPDKLKVIDSLKRALIAESQDITKHLWEESIIPPLGTTVEEYYENRQIMLVINDGILAPILTGINPTENNLYKIIMHKVRGSFENFISITTGIGQIRYAGKRAKLDTSGRSVANALVNDNDPTMRGYVNSSYERGLTPNEIFFHSVENRLSLIAKALSTSVAGSINRRSIKSTESLVVDNLFKVVDTLQVLELIYNGIGTDPRFLVNVQIPTLSPGVDFKTFESQYHYIPGGKTNKLCDEEFAQICRDRELYYELFCQWQYTEDMQFQHQALMPFDVTKILTNNTFKVSGSVKPSGGLDFETVVKTVRELCEYLPYCLVHPVQWQKRNKLADYMNKNLTLMRIYIRSVLNMSTLTRMNITPEVFELTIEEIKYTYTKTMIAYGKAVGILASHCISEPLTQDVLNSHHFVGKSGGRVRNTTRINEILGIRPTESMAVIITSFYLREPMCYDESETKKFATFIEVINLEMFIRGWEIFSEKFGKPAHKNYAHEAGMIAEYMKYSAVGARSGLTNWCIRFELDKEKLMEKQIPVRDIYARLIAKFPEIFIVYSDENSDNVVLRIYMTPQAFEKPGFGLAEVKKLAVALKTESIRGIPGIKFAKYEKREVMEYNPKTQVAEVRNKYLIIANGTNLQELCCYTVVDRTTLQTDSIMDTYKMLGLVAARQKIFTELMFQVDSPIPTHHVIYSIIMTSRGLTTIDRHGNGRRKNSVLSRIDEGSPIINLQEAATNGDTDNFQSPIPNILFGGPIRLGSNYNQLSVDVPFLNKLYSGITTTAKNDFDDLL